MRRFAFIIVLCSLFLHNQKTYSQLPSLSLSLGGGINLPQSDLKNSYGMTKMGYAYGGKFKLGLPVVPLNIVALGYYNSFTNETGYPIDFFLKKMTIITVGAGIEYVLIPAPIVRPYLGIDATMNLISGIQRYPGPADQPLEKNLELANRIGMGIGLGLDFNFPLSPLAFDIEAKYRFANVVGKEYKSNTITTYYLNDGKAPDNLTDQNRTLNYINIVIGLKFKAF